MAIITCCLLADSTLSNSIASGLPAGDCSGACCVGDDVCDGCACGMMRSCFAAFMGNVAATASSWPGGGGVAERVREYRPYTASAAIANANSVTTFILVTDRSHFAERTTDILCLLLPTNSARAIQ